MNILLILIISLIIYTYLGYPVVLIILAKLFPKRVEKKDITPKVSLLIAAYNEENCIATKIENSLKLDYPKDLLEIVVVSDGSTDRTDEIVRSYADQGIKLFRVEGRVGKTEARNQAVLANKSEVIVFSDATAIYERDAILKLVRNFADESVGMVSGNLVYKNNNSSVSLATRVYWSYEKIIKRAQGRLWTLTGAIGCINAFRRELYIPLPSNVIEDFTTPLTIVGQGYRVVYEEEAISYERNPKQMKQEFSMRVRVIRGGQTGLIYALKKLGSINHLSAMMQVLSHKVLRWSMPIFLVILLLATMAQTIITGLPIYYIFLSLQLLFYLLAVIGIYIKINGIFKVFLALPTYFVIVNSASLKAIYLTFTKELEATWETNVY